MSTGSEIEAAAQVYAWLSSAYLGVLLLAAVLTLLVWRAGNRLQDAIRRDADARLATAHAAVEGARAEAARLKEGAGQSSEEIARAHAEAARAIERAAALEKEVAEARLEQERLKARVAWRSISPEAAARLVQELTGRSRVLAMRCVSNDPEATALAAQLGGVFQQAGWRVVTGSATYHDRFIAGLFIPDDGPATELVRQAFVAAGIAFNGQPPPRPSVDVMYVAGQDATVLVGSKPVPDV
jgi:hypothetical protein